MCGAHINRTQIAIIKEESAKLNDNRLSMPLCYPHDPPSSPTLVIVIIIRRINRDNVVLGETFI